VIRSDVLQKIVFADVRRLDTSSTAVERFLGIQRRLNPDRRKDIEEFVKTADATFPTSIVIAVTDDRCIDLAQDGKTLSFFSVTEDQDGPAVLDTEVAQILDGQHRLAGLKDAEIVGEFDVPVTVFTDLDIALEAYIFVTINLAQTKVNRSLAYDLFAYARSRSPQKTCHDVTVSLNDQPGSPFKNRIKRLGSATPGVKGETLTQATFVQRLLPYITRNAVEDQDILRRGRRLAPVRDVKSFGETPLRNLFIRGYDDIIADTIWEYFESVRARWPNAWAAQDRGHMLSRTNGFAAFMRVFGSAFITLGGSDDRQPKASDYARIWKFSNLDDDDFITDNFVPGTSGEKKLTEVLESAIRVYKLKMLNRS
jgi:DGQHR domain-containing protein